MTALRRLMLFGTYADMPDWVPAPPDGMENPIFGWDYDNEEYIWVDAAHTHEGTEMRVVLHPEIVDPPEPLWLDGDWLYMAAEDWD